METCIHTMFIENGQKWKKRNFRVLAFKTELKYYYWMTKILIQNFFFDNFLLIIIIGILYVN